MTLRSAAPHLLSVALSSAVLAACASTPSSMAATDDRTDAPRVLALDECLDPDRARSWALVDSDELLVDAGRHRYHIEFAYACPDVSTAAAVVFRGTGGLGRVCGHPGDAVVASSGGRSSQPCTIRSIETLTDAQYQQYFDEGELESTAVADGDVDH